MSSIPTKYLSRLIVGRISACSFLTLLFAASFATLLLFFFKNTLGSVEDRAGSLPWAWFADTAMEDRVVIVSIDEESISEIGPWPWSREVMADLVGKINEAGAQLQIHDVLYPVGERNGDRAFARSLAENQKSIVAQLPVLQPLDSELKSGTLTHALRGASCDIQTQSVMFPKAENFIGASDTLASIPKGHIAPVIDSDGSVRKLPAVICFGENAYPALAIAAFLQLGSEDSWVAEVSAGDGIFAPEHSLILSSFPGLDIPIDSEGNMRISFEKSPSSFQSVSAIRVLEGDYDRDVFDNALVLVGATAFGLDDIVPTPYSGSSPGVELQARVLTSILDNSVPYVPKGRASITISISLLVGALLFFIASFRGRAAIFGLPAFSLLTALVALAAHGIFLTYYNFWVGWMSTALFGFMGGLALLTVEHLRLRIERGLVMQNLSSYLPSETARKVAFQLPTSNIQAERCEVTLLSADLRNFSALGESRPPEESAAVLHYFFTRASQIVEDSGGKIHEYKGDSVLAVWEGGGCDSANRALSAALELENQVNGNLLTELSIDGLEPLALGIGVEQGPVLSGSIGPAHRRAHTLCGEAVTVTLRIQEMTADLSYPVLIGEVAARYLPDLPLQPLGSYLLPGLAKSHALYTPLEKEKSQRDNLTLLRGGLG